MAVPIHRLIKPEVHRLPLSHGASLKWQHILSSESIVRKVAEHALIVPGRRLIAFDPSASPRLLTSNGCYISELGVYSSIGARDILVDT